MFQLWDVLLSQEKEMWARQAVAGLRVHRASAQQNPWAEDAQMRQGKFILGSLNVGGDLGALTISIS